MNSVWQNAIVVSIDHNGARGLLVGSEVEVLLPGIEGLPIYHIQHTAGHLWLVRMPQTNLTFEIPPWYVCMSPETQTATLTDFQDPESRNFVVCSLNTACGPDEDRL